MNIRELLVEKEHNKHHLERYIRFIEDRKRIDRKQHKGSGFEDHHILPKAKDMFPEYKNLNVNKWNSAVLTFREHFIAHYMLAKAFPTYNSVLYSCIKLFKNSKSKNSRAYEDLKVLKNAAQSLFMKTNNPFKGKSHTAESRKKMGPQSQEQRNAAAEWGRTRVRSPEELAALSEAAKKQWQETDIGETLMAAGKRWRESLTVDEYTKHQEGRLAAVRAAFTEEFVCPHCNYVGRHRGNMRRFHNDNCKSKELVQAVSPLEMFL